jgi:ankyrin repeat protein
MPKKSSKKGSKKQTPAAQTNLVPHRSPNLADLLELAKAGKHSDVQQYFSAGGSANVLVKVPVQHIYDTPMPDSCIGLLKAALMGDHFAAPLITSVALSKHSDAAISIQLLLEAGADVDAIADSTASGILSRTALVQCSISGNLTCVQALLQGGADPCHQASSGDGMSALHFAAAHDRLDICRALHTASSGRTLELVGKGDRMSATPLIAACAMEKYAAVKLLCALGAAASEGRDTSILQFLLQQDGINVNKGDGIGGSTALMCAVEQGNLAAVNLLLQSGADVLQLSNPGWSAGFVAAASGQLRVLQLLMQHGVDLRTNVAHNFTMLMQAARSNQPRVAEFLISKGLSVNAVSENGSTVLHYAADSTSTGTESMRLLLAHGADVNASNRKGEAPLHRAAQSGQPDKVKVLIAAGGDVLHCDSTGGTALHEAVYSKRLTVVKLLLEHGADTVLNTMQCEQWDGCDAISALMLCEDAAVLKLLLTAGADVHAVTRSGDTCLHIAARYSYSAPVVCLLIKAGADMNAVNRVGKTAAQIAHDAGNTLIEQLLIRAAQQL